LRSRAGLEDGRRELSHSRGHFTSKCSGNPCSCTRPSFLLPSPNRLVASELGPQHPQFTTIHHCCLLLSHARHSLLFLFAAVLPPRSLTCLLALRRSVPFSLLPRSFRRRSITAIYPVSVCFSAMYITSDLFSSGSSDARIPHFDSVTAPATPDWNTMPDSQHAALGKRKRRIDIESAEGPNAKYEGPLDCVLDRSADTYRSSTYTSCQRLLPHAGRALKRHTVTHTVPDTAWTTLYTQSSSVHLTPEARPHKHLKRTSPKAKPPFVKSTSHLMDVETDGLTSNSSCSTHTLPSQALRPCHICHTAPKRKKDLENYHECKRCQETTCFICARQCADNACREKICRKCCIEVGEEGDTLCLGCYTRNVNL
jgi:hypothetical protein